jgi:radical SAM protein with 4Fe4S-binding SPASM domain
VETQGSITKGMHVSDTPKLIATLTCDFRTTAIGTRSRLADDLHGKPVLTHTLEKLLQLESLSDIILLVPQDQLPRAHPFLTNPRIQLLELTPRSPGMHARIRTGRQWNLHAWRGGAGQFTFFDEEYHPAAIASAVKKTNADHVLVIHSHSAFLDVPITAALIHHHLHKNHEMKLTYTPCAPGLSGIILRADIALEMGEKDVFPWQLLAYDPNNPTFDTLIRDACLQVDPALSKIPNRFTMDTDTAWHRHPADDGRNAHSAAALALATATTIAPGIAAPSHISPYPRELEIELTPRRLTTPPGTTPALLRESRGELSPHHWTTWLAKQQFPDDLLLTFAGEGDPLLNPPHHEILRAARSARPLSICVQTDLASDIAPIITAIHENLIDILSITTYGHTQQTYNKVANADLHPLVMKNLTTLAPIISNNNGIPLVIPRLLKVRDTIPELEPFFDAWIKQAGWAVIDYPTDRAGSVPFAGVVDMAPPKRKPCRRIFDRLLLRSNGTATPCDQDAAQQLPLGHLESHTLEQLWTGQPLSQLRNAHTNQNWHQVSPCTTCKEWHRP